jgi:putative YhdH/YhfP family quinone oxidoreductase
MTDSIPDHFRAFRIFDNEDGHLAAIVEQTIEDQTDGDVVVRISHSSVNYKDALAGTGKGKILRKFPLNGGIDLAGTVVRSDSADFNVGDRVLMTGSGLSETRDGGYSEYLRVSSEWLVPLPTGLSAQDAMVLGTAGFTAALGLYRMEALGQRPEMGPICITGASGGVGSLAVDIFSAAGYEVTAITGKLDEFEWLHSLGASQCISRQDLLWPKTPMASAQFAGALDTVGGEMLSGLTRVIKPWGTIGACGMVGGIGIETTVMPFIIRGIGLVGINSAGCAYPLRKTVWERLGNEWKPRHLERITQPTIGLDDLPAAFETLLEGKGKGRIPVQIGT